MEALQALVSNPPRERSAPISLVHVPLVFPSSQTFFRILSQFVLEERRCGKIKAVTHSYGPLPVTWRGPLQFYFSSKTHRVTQLHVGMEVAIGDPPVGGLVSSISNAGNIIIQLSKSIPRTDRVSFRVFFNAIPYDRQRRALAHLEGMDRFWQRIMIGDITESRQATEARLCTCLSDTIRLNTSQRTAVTYALSHRFAVIQGPPGTGKSTCAAQQAVTQFKAGMKVLVVARTNEGANNLVAKIAQLDPGDGLIRVVGQSYQGGELPTEIVPYCSHLGIIELTKWRKLKAEKNKIRHSHLVVTTTCCSGGSRFRKVGYHSVIVDEANQLVDPELAILLRFNPTFITLYGDHAQIGPFVESMRAKALGYGQSLIERLPKIAADTRTRDPPVDYPHFILQEQYRMHQELAEFPSHEFYADAVRTAPGLVRQVNPRIPFPRPNIPLVFINVQGREQKSSNGTSVLNLAEIVTVGNVLASLERAEVEPDTIGIVSFYAAAVDAAWELLPNLQNVNEDFLNLIKIQTVDAYEGREKDYIILMCVRANTVHEIGFLNNTGRMNVALTRAKHGLFVVGNCDTFRSEATGPVWARFVAHCEAKGVVVNDWPPRQTSPFSYLP
jgi:regulator of nonsense transcripts 1